MNFRWLPFFVAWLVPDQQPELNPSKRQHPTAWVTARRKCARLNNQHVFLLGPELFRIAGFWVIYKWQRGRSRCNRINSYSTTTGLFNSLNKLVCDCSNSIYCSLNQSLDQTVNRNHFQSNWSFKFSFAFEKGPFNLPPTLSKFAS